MRKVILYVAPSLDGFIARKDGSIDWFTKYESTDEDYGYNAFLEGIDALLMGRKTYEQILGFREWPYDGKQCFVFSKESINDPRVTAVPEPVPFTRALKEKDGKNIWLVGGGQAIALLLVHGLIDELILTIIPVILGGGIRLFPSGDSGITCTLRGEKTFSSGLVQVHYSVETGSGR
jgi:dihydrofolate reductase